MKEICIDKQYLERYNREKLLGETIAEYTHRVFPDYFKDEELNEAARRTCEFEATSEVGDSNGRD